jgi:uncharacterized repeat protein (TIGR01451 family)
MSAHNKIILSLLFFVILATQLAMANDAVIAYAVDGSNSPRVMFWNSSGSGSWGPEITLSSSGNQVNFAVIKTSPVSGKFVLVTLSDDEQLDSYVCTSNCTVAGNWTHNSITGTLTSSTIRTFDVEFETSSGDAVLVYSIVSGTSANDLAYRVLPAANTAFGSVAYIDDAGIDADYDWVRLDRKPTSSEELLLVASVSTDGDTNAWVWNGSIWGTMQQITASASPTTYEALAVRYSADGSKGMVIAGTGTTGDVASRYWNGSTWSSSSTFDSGDGTVRWLNLKADPASGSDDLQAVIVDANDDLGTSYWNGSSWAATMDIETSLPSSTRRTADFEWNPSGSTGRLVWGYSGSTTQLRQMECAPQCTGGVSTISTYNNETRFLTLYKNPTDSDTINILGARLARYGGTGTAYRLGSLSFNGTSYANYGDTNITSSALEQTYESYCIAFFNASSGGGNTTPPTVNLVSPANNTNSSLTMQTFTFNETDDQSSTANCSLYLDGTLNTTNGSTSNNTNTNFVVNNISQGKHYWMVGCKDSSNNTGNSSIRNFTIDTTAPTVNSVNPANNTNSSSIIQTFTFNETDPWSSTANCSLYLDGTLNTTNGSTSNNTNTNFVVNNISQGKHYWMVKCNDTSGNVGNSSTRNFTIDTTQPSITLNSPVPGANLTNPAVNFNWTATDNLANPMLCNLTINGTFSATNVVSANSTPTNYTVVFTQYGEYFWNVTCIDNAGNVNTSETREFVYYYANVSGVKSNITAQVASQGGMVQYNIIVNNTGNTSLSVTVNDTLDTTNLAYNYSSDGGSFSTPYVTWALVLNPGEVKNLYLNATVLDYPSECESTTNSVLVTGVPPRGVPVTDGNSITVPVCLAEVSAVKANITAEVASQGGTVSYFITVTNTGNVFLNITVNDTLDPAMNYTYSDPGPTTNTSQEIIWAFNNVAPGLMEQIHLNATVNNYPTECQDTTNNLNVIGVPDNGNNAMDSYNLVVPVCLADVSVIKLNQDLGQPSPGGEVEFNITIKNEGNVTLEHVGVTDVLPDGLLFDYATPDDADDVTGQTLTWWDVGPLDPGESYVLYVKAVVDDGVVDNVNTSAVLNNKVNVTGTPPNGDDVTANDDADVTVYYAEVGVVKAHITPIMPISPGGMVLWQINITNTGATELGSVLVMDTLESGLEYNSSTTTPDNVSDDKLSINWTTGAIMPTGVIIIEFYTTANAVGTYNNNVEVIGYPVNGDPVNDSDSAMVGINSSGIGVTKTVASDTVLVNKNATYTLSIPNNGEVDLTVEVVDTLPANVAFQGTDFGSPVVAGQTVTWSGISLPVGGSITINYNVSANATGTYVNDVVVTGVPPNGDDVSDGDSTSFTAGTPPSPSHDDGDGAEPLSVSFSSDCDGNVVTVESGGDAIAGAQVKVNGDVIGNTNSDGEITFEGCGLVDATVLAKKSGYIQDHIHVDTVACSQCVQCVNDNECPTDNACTSGKCVPITCECGKIENHACTQYECCSDSECPQGELCTNNVCNPPFECVKNADCGATEYCSMQTGQAGGECKEVAGGCGAISNHAFTAYEFPYGCATQGCPACPTGYVCEDNKCSVYELIAPPTMEVGDNATLHVNVDGKPCVLCEIVITNPDGSKTTGRTDGNGDFILPLGQSGAYRIELPEEGFAKTINVANPPKANVVEAGAKTPVTSTPSSELLPLPCIVGLLLLALAIILFYLWKREKKEDKAPMHAKIKK